MSFTPFQAPLLSGLADDGETARHFSAKAELAAFARFEIALAQAEAAVGVIDGAAAERIAATGETFEPDLADLQAGTARDGVVVPAYVRQFRTAVGETHAASLHYGSTSQDVIDTALVLRLVPVLDILRGRLSAALQALDGLRERSGSHRLMGHTRMQRAVPITVADRLAAWHGPLDRALSRLGPVAERLLVLQFGGAAGNCHVLGDEAPAVAAELARRLDIGLPDHHWQSQRDRLADFANWLALTSGALGKIGQDVALMAQNEMDEIALSGGGGSSAMAHKKNPVKAETLVALARFAATLQPGMSHALIHEQERSGAAWTLEWLVLPQLVVATGAALRNAVELLESVERMGEGA